MIPLYGLVFSPPTPLLLRALDAGDDRPEGTIDTIEPPEDRVTLYAELLCRHEYGTPGSPGVIVTPTGDYGIYAYARLLAKREAMGEIDYDDVVDEFFPRSYLISMREIPPETTFE